MKVTRPLYSRRIFLSQGVLGATCLGLSIACTSRAPFLDEPDQMALSKEAMDIIMALSPSILGIDRVRLMEMRNEYADQLSHLFEQLPPTAQENLCDLFRFLNFPPLRWSYGVFSNWDTCSDMEAEKFVRKLFLSNLKLIQLVHQNLVSYLATTYYSLNQVYPDIHYPPMVNFGDLYE